MHFRTFRLQPPHAPPLSGHSSCSGRSWPPARLVGLPAVLRTSSIAGSLISRIRPNRVCVAALVWTAVLRTILSFPVALHTLSPERSYFPVVAGSTATEGLSPSYARSFSSARARLYKSQRLECGGGRNVRGGNPAARLRVIDPRSGLTPRERGRLLPVAEHGEHLFVELRELGGKA